MAGICQRVYKRYNTETCQSTERDELLSQDASLCLFPVQIKEALNQHRGVDFVRQVFEQFWKCNKILSACKVPSNVEPLDCHGSSKHIFRLLKLFLNCAILNLAVFTQQAQIAELIRKLKDRFSALMRFEAILNFFEWLLCLKLEQFRQVFLVTKLLNETEFWTDVSNLADQVPYFFHFHALLNYWFQFYSWPFDVVFISQNIW